jgi:hypothetical protein
LLAAAVAVAPIHLMKRAAGVLVVIVQVLEQKIQVVVQLPNPDSYRKLELPTQSQ